MDDLTDLEINGKIATITGVVIEHITGNTIYIVDNETGLETGYDEYMEYNPLTDDGLCFRLMIKHEIKVSTYYKIGDRVPFYGAETPDLEEVEARTPHKCVCLAIMSAYD